MNSNFLGSSLFQKLVFGITLHFFAWFIKEKDDSFIYSFLSFYVLERFLKYLEILIYFPPIGNARYIHMIMNLLQLDLFHLYIRKSQFQGLNQIDLKFYLFEGILFEFPQHLIILVWYFNSNQTLFNSFLIGVILAYIAIQFAQISSFNMHYLDNPSLSSQERVKAYAEVLLSFVQISTYYCLIIFNSNYHFKNSQFTYFASFFLSLSVLMFLITLWKQSYYLDLAQNFLVSSAFCIRQLINYFLDHRVIFAERRINFMNDIDPSQPNQQIFFSILIQGYLIVTYLISILEQNVSMGVFQIVIVSCTILCIVISLKRFVYFSFIQKLFIIRSKESLMTFIQKYRNNPVNYCEYPNSSIAYVMFKEQGERFENFHLLLEFNGVQEIRFANTFRCYFEKTYQFQQINFEYYNLPSLYVLQLFQNVTIAPEVKKIKLNFKEHEYEQQIIKTLISKNQAISLEYPDSNLLSFYNKYVSEMNTAIISIIVFQREVSFLQYTNPDAILYDLSIN